MVPSLRRSNGHPKIFRTTARPKILVNIICRIIFSVFFRSLESLFVFITNGMRMTV